MNMPAGKLNKRIVFQVLETFQDTAGDTIEEWSDYVEVWARIDPISVNRFTASRAQQSMLVADIVIRYRTDLDISMRILHRGTGKIYSPDGFLPDKENGLEYMTIPASEGVRKK